MYSKPELPVPRVITVFPEEAIGLWLKALERPDADTRCKAADAIALARRRGLKGLEKTIPPLLAALDRPDQHPTVRLPVAQALIALEAKDAAPSLFRQAQAGGSDLRELVEPALARWDYQPARAVWRARLSDPAATQRSLALAIQALETVRDLPAADRLREMALSPATSAAIRIQVAHALGVLRTEGLEPDAELLLADFGLGPRGIDIRLAAVSMLVAHKSARATSLLDRLARDSEPAVAAVAVARLIELDPMLVVPMVEQLVARPDAKLRALAVDVLFRQPSDKHIRLLGDRLGDPHMEVRAKARDALYGLAAQKGFQRAVIEQGSRVLAMRDWRGLEQSAILLSRLDHKAAGRRFVELLDFDRPEVYIAAAWGLRRLAVPETLGDVVRFVEIQQRRLRASAASPDTHTVFIDHQLSQLNQLLGQQKYAAAEAVLVPFLPRMEKPLSVPVGAESRAASIWALGTIREGQPGASFVAALEERLNDVRSLPPEDVRVRRMCAITLGRLRVKEALPSLRQYFLTGEPTFDPVNNACGWAIEQVTGEVMPAPKTIEKVQRDWFLMPYK
jgi:HEAT repeat protein